MYGRLSILAVLALGTALPTAAQVDHTLPTDLAAPGKPTLIPKEGASVFSEGVAADWQGNIYSNEMGNADRTMQLKTGADSSKQWRKANDDPNGMWLDTKNNLVICQTRAIIRVKAGAAFDNKTDTLYKYPSGGQDFNDVTGDSKDNLFFTNFNGRAVYFRDADSGKTRVVLSNQPKPNGVEWDEERKVLYVNENEAGKVSSYTVNADFSLSPRPPFVNVPSADGITLDERGNVYVVAFGAGVHVFSPEGQKRGEIPISGNQVTNLAFGGSDFKTLYIITNLGLYKIPMKVKGYKSGNYTVSLRRAAILPAAKMNFRRTRFYNSGIIAVTTGNPTVSVADFNGRMISIHRKSALGD